MSAVNEKSEIMDFYMSQPVELMRDLVQRAAPEIAGGAVVLMSGMCGIYKTNGFLDPLSSRYDCSALEFLHFGQDDILSRNVSGKPVFIDEATVVIDSPEAMAVLALVEYGAIVFAGLQKTVRDEARQKVRGELESLGRKVVDLGDHSTSAVDADSSGQLLDRLGYDKSMIEFVVSNPVLRVPRFFHALTRLKYISSFHVKDGEGYGVEHFQRDMSLVSRDFLNFSVSMKRKEVSMTRKEQEHATELVFLINNAMTLQVPVPHPILISVGQHTFEEAKTVYRLLEIPFPDDDEIDAIVEYCGGRIIDPRTKT